MERVSTFANLGIDLSGVNNIQMALSAANLDYLVEKQPVFYAYEGKQIQMPGVMTNVRLTDGHSYGPVSDHYFPIQNVEAFDFINYINAPIEFVKGGETQSGMVYVICKLEEENILGDRFTPYVLFRNSFNGAYSLAACVCPLRIVCHNQINLSLKKTENTVNIKHTKTAQDKMKAAQLVMANTVNYLHDLKAQAEVWAGQKVSKSDVMTVISQLFPIKEGMTDRQKAVITSKIQAFVTAYNAEDNTNFRGTAWGIINAATDFYTHEQPVRQTATAEENRFISVTFDPRIMNKVVSLVTAVA